MYRLKEAEPVFLELFLLLGIPRKVAPRFFQVTCPAEKNDLARSGFNDLASF